MSLLICQLEHIFKYYKNDLRSIKDLILIEEIENLILKHKQDENANT